jgi:DNA-binding NarL/FixJ family response regulator
MPIKVLLADDDALVREGLRVLIGRDPRFEVVAAVENGRLAVDACRKRDVDVALLDVRMPVMSGLDAASQIAAETGTRVLMLTTFDDEELIVGAVKTGARGYMLKSSAPDRIMEAIAMVAAGGTVLQDAAMDALTRQLSLPRPGRMDGVDFSDREREIITAIAEGLSNRQIAEQLFISEGTVKNYVSTILGKTGLSHRTQIAISYLTGRAPPGT